MLVYRIEDSSGRGAFLNLIDCYDLIAFYEGVKRAYDHPGPTSAREHGTELCRLFAYDPRYRSYRFGCRSKHQLRMWFRSPAGRAAMANHGGVMVTYYVPDQYVKHGRYQVAFETEHATKISSVPANDW